MAQGMRPGGLTALAVLNFIFGGLGAVGALLALAFIGAVDNAGGLEKIKETAGTGIIYVSLLLGALSAGLLIASGVGYIKQKRFLGRTLGNSYAVISLLSTVLSIVAIKNGFGIGTIIGLVYPLVTLFLLNTTFKDDLVN